MSSIHQENKTLIGRFRAALYDCDASSLQKQLQSLFSADAIIRLANPFETLDGPDALFEQAYHPLLDAIPDLERRDFIMMAGSSGDDNWVGCAGHYIGVFEHPWLDIPPTRHAAFMRYHEFFRIEDNKIVEMQALWDIPQLMMQASAWPMSPSLGVEWMVPGPASNDGIITAPYNTIRAERSKKLVVDMLVAMGKYPLQGDVDIMELDHYWHPKMMWYGPAGIGSMRRIAGFRNWHQIPFLNAMPDRKGSITGKAIFFGDHDYAATTGWPNLQVTVSGNGWMGIAPANQKITMRSLDFWRCENGSIRENWVLVDLLSVYNQLGVDVFARMREYTYARQPKLIVPA